MQEIAIFAWFVIAGVIGLNFLSAGAAAMLHIWRGTMRRRSRITLSAMVAGLFPASSLFVVVLEANSSEIVAVLGFGLVTTVVVCGLLALPMAIIVSRKLEGGQDVSGTFE